VFVSEATVSPLPTPSAAAPHLLQQLVGLDLEEIAPGGHQSREDPPGVIHLLDVVDPMFPRRRSRRGRAGPGDLPRSSWSIVQAAETVPESRPET